MGTGVCWEYMFIGTGIKTGTGTGTGTIHIFTLSSLTEAAIKVDDKLKDILDVLKAFISLIM